MNLFLHADTYFAECKALLRRRYNFIWSRECEVFCNTFQIYNVTCSNVLWRTLTELQMSGLKKQLELRRKYITSNIHIYKWRASVFKTMKMNKKRGKASTAVMMSLYPPEGW